MTPDPHLRANRPQAGVKILSPRRGLRQSGIQCEDIATAIYPTLLGAPVDHAIATVL